MANSKAITAKGTKSAKRSTLIYPAAFILPALIMIACGIIFRFEAIVPYIVAYALAAAIPGFFLASKNYGMAALLTSIVFVVGIGGYVTADNMLQRSGLLSDKAFVSALSSALDKFPAFITQNDLDDVKVLIFEGNYDNDYGSPIDGFKLTLGYDEALMYMKAENQDEYDNDTVEGYFKSATSEIDISDYSSLAKFTNLEYISVNQPNSFMYYYYGIAPSYLAKFNDFSFFENMKSLKDLIIFNTAASDFAPLSGLTSLENLSIQYCNVKDASVFGNLTGLKSLNLAYAGIYDISFSSTLGNLTQLYLPGNQIENIDALKELANLTDLVLNSNQIEDIAPIGGMSQLANLYLSNNQIKDTSALSGLGLLETVYLSTNQIEDASPLFTNALLKNIDISENALTQMSGIENCTSLETLYISGNQITDLTPLSGLENLANLYADNNLIEDLSPLEQVISLADISLANNQISDISPLANLGNLTNVNLDENLIADFSPLESLEEGGTSVSGRDNQLIEYDDDDHDHEDEYGVQEEEIPEE